MEHSAFEALIIGVNVTIFIIALSAAILLMSNTLDMVDFANESAIQGMNGTIAESVGETKEQIYTGSQLLTYYRKIKNEEIEELNYDIKIITSEYLTPENLSTFIENNNLSVYINKEFILEYREKTNGKHTYVLTMQE